MTVLLDTCTFLYLIGGEDRLSRVAREIVADAQTQLLLSPISLFEIVQKYAIGKLELKEPPSTLLPRMSQLLHVASLPLTEEAVIRVETLPLHHRDPFDRLLVCQALDAGIPILTPDPLISQYAVSTLW